MVEVVLLKKIGIDVTKKLGKIFFLKFFCNFFFAVNKKMSDSTGSSFFLYKRSLFKDIKKKLWEWCSFYEICSK